MGVLSNSVLAARYSWAHCFYTYLICRDRFTLHHHMDARLRYICRRRSRLMNSCNTI